MTLSDQPMRLRQRAFGYSQEDLRVLLAPMAIEAAEPIGSMGNDLSLAVLSDQAPPLFSYFKQLFAQVTNPPIDPIREEIVMSLATTLGNERNLFDETPEHAHKLLLEPADPAQPRARDAPPRRPRGLRRPHDRHHLADRRGPRRDERAIDRICRQAREAIAEGVQHHHPVRPAAWARGARRCRRCWRWPPSTTTSCSQGTRLRAGIIVESGEPREVHHFATLIGFGASAINPYLMLETLDELVIEGRIARTGPDGRDVQIGAEEAAQNVVKAIGKGLLKTISKMGISTIQSYRGAQIFEAVGLDRELIDTHFTYTASRIGGVGLRRARDRGAAAPRPRLPGPARRAAARRRRLRLAARRRAPHVEPGDDRARPARRARAQRRRRAPRWRATRRRARRSATARPTRSTASTPRRSTSDAAREATLRGLLEIGADGGGPIPLEEVEPASEIVRRFCTGAMSLGSISREAHETLAIAMNRIGGRSNTGEGGEDPSRFTPDANGDRRRSAIKQVASGRFGVTIHYLVNADELQIKMAQGAKPGEGGQLPGHKVDDYIGSIRHTTPGVGLISPPPHHDIYSIEDLKQLIYDLRCANPKAQVSVKLVSEVGVGTVAAGVSKANADRVLIAGHDGGTGASPLSSIQAAGRAVGDRPGRDPADAAAQRPALADRRADRRPAEDRPRRRDRRDARRGRDGLLDGAR